MTTIDTNYILRFLTRDIEDQHLISRKVIINKNIKKYVSAIIIAEVNYILQNHYGFDKHKVICVLVDFLSIKHIESEEYVKTALQIYEHESISFYDSLIIAESITNKNELKTFDTKLLKAFTKYNSN